MSCQFAKVELIGRAHITLKKQNRIITTLLLSIMLASTILTQGEY